MIATILVITANDPNDHLQNIAREGKDIQRLLNSAPRKNYDVALIPETTTEDIVNELNVPNRQVEILHSQNSHPKSGCCTAWMIIQKIKFIRDMLQISEFY